MGKFNASEYRKRKAERLKSIEPQWVTVPSGAEFLLRATPALASAVASQLPNVLTTDAVQAWKEQGIELKEGESHGTAVTEDDATHNLQFMARIVMQGCVSPKFVQNPQNEDELKLDELETDDLLFIVRYCTGQIQSNVRLQGGRVIEMADLKSGPKQCGVLPRTGTNG